MHEKITTLEKKLHVYENPHTPSSQRRFKGGNKDNTPHGKRGAPQEHHGATNITISWDTYEVNNSEYWN